MRTADALRVVHSEVNLDLARGLSVAHNPSVLDRYLNEARRRLAAKPMLPSRRLRLNRVLNWLSYQLKGRLADMQTRRRVPLTAA